MRRAKTELLAPAGSYEAFRAGLNAGADAFYLGAARFGARAYAENFSCETLLKTIDEAHIFGKKIYLTVNTLFKESELGELYDMLLPLYEHGLDAVIVQDLGAFRFIKEFFPELPIHASTQMAVTGYEGAEFIEKCGASRVIPARELSLDEIRLIRAKTSLEIECFVHGALCYCYSGMCLMSSFIGGRSGNRGKCAQPCRMPYRVSRDGADLSGTDKRYALNTKDICLIDNIAELVEAGIDSFKIEGRMKRPEYAAGVVSVYRKYLDLYESGLRGAASADDKELLRALFNRGGFSKGYFFSGGGAEMMAFENERPSRGHNSNIDKAYGYVRENIIGIPLKKLLNAEFRISDGSAKLTVTDGKTSVSALSEEVQEAVNQPLTSENVLKQTDRTGDTDFKFENIDIDICGNVFMTAKQLNGLRRQALKAFEDKLAGSYRRKALRKRVSSKNAEKILSHTVHEGGELYVSVENKAQFEAANTFESISGIYVPYHVYMDDFAESERIKYKNVVFIALPYISRHTGRGGHEAEIRALAESGARFLVRNLEDAGFLVKNGFADSIRLDYTLYTMTGSSLDFWRENGVSENTAPVELNFRELSDRDNSDSEIVIYGRLPLMVSAQCVVKNYVGCDGSNGRVFLTDRKKISFPAVSDCKNCCSLIYNSVPLSLISEAESVSGLGFKRYRASFVFEKPEEVSRIINEIAEAFKTGVRRTEDFSFTKGHFRRGVE